MSSPIQDVYRTRERSPEGLRRWITIVIAVFLAILAVRWGLLEAVFFAPDQEACRAANGACWAVVTSQWKLVLLGTYPLQSIWRPLAVIILLIAMFFVPLALPRLSVLAGSWIPALVLSIALLDGRVFGLPTVETRDWGGLPLTLLLSQGIILVAFPIGLVMALARHSSNVVLRSLSLVAVECIRGVPLVSLLFFTTLVLPLFLSGLSSLDRLTAAAIAITLFNAAYISEVFRGGLMTVPHVQIEAAKSLGFRWVAMQRLIILPQAIKVCAPSLVNHAVGIVKDTSLVAVIGLFDLMNTAHLAIADPRWGAYFIEICVVIGIAYFLMCTAVATLGRRLSARLDGPAQSQGGGAPFARHAEELRSEPLSVPGH